MTPLRRSQRLAAKKGKTNNPTPAPVIASQLRKQPGRTESVANKGEYLESWLQSTTDELSKKKTSKTKSIKVQQYISDSASDSEDETDGSDVESGITWLDELEDQTAEWITLPGENPSRHYSIDSRYDPGNEDYERDDSTYEYESHLTNRNDLESDGITILTVSSKKRKRRLIKKPVTRIEPLNGSDSETLTSVSRSSKRQRMLKRKVRRIDSSSDESDASSPIVVRINKKRRLIRRPVVRDSSTGDSASETSTSPIPPLKSRITFLEAASIRSKSTSSKLFYTDVDTNASPSRRASTNTTISRLSRHTHNSCM
jgi:hypothetical protein